MRAREAAALQRAADMSVATRVATPDSGRVILLPRRAEAAAPVVGGVSIRPQPLKRLFDIVVALCALVFLAPLLLSVWVLVRATSPGPGLYWSKRVGRYGVIFDMPKFRSMRVDAPLQPREQLGAAASMITPLGRLLRASSIDELPQFWCVLIGTMSLIGPRPLIPTDPGAHARQLFPASLTVRPGLSGLAQVKGRNLVKPRMKARYDAVYARKAGLGLDVALIARTLKILFTRVGIL